MYEIILSAIALGLLWTIMTLGVYITYRILDVADLSVEGTIVLGGSVAARMIAGGSNPWIATLCAIVAGLFGGFITGILHTKLKIPALLSGILTMIALYSINLRVMGKANTPLLRVDTVFTPFQELGLTKTKAALLLGLILVIVVSLVAYWFFGTELGSAIRATGNNQNMVRAQGVHTGTMIIIGLVLSNGLVALSGAIIAQYQSYTDINMGNGSIVIGLASLIIGEVLVGTKSFKRTLIALAVGAVLYRIIIALVLKLGMDGNDLKLFTAITVAFCLSLPMIKSGLLNSWSSKKYKNTSLTNNENKGGR
jgi:putative ABC transport system permease protein